MNIFQGIGRIQVRLLNSEAKRDYLLCILLPLSSFFIAWAIGNFSSIKLAPNSSLYQACQACQICQACKSTISRDIIFKGYGSRLNWLHFLVTVPLSLYTLRWAARRLFGWNAAGRRSELAPILDVFSNSPPQNSVADHLQAVLVDPRNLVSALFLAVLIHIADMWELLSVYTAGRSSAGCPREGDWSVFFLVPEARMDWPSNLTQVALAYSNQFVVATIALLVFIIFLRYNMFYLDSIYQRYRGRDMTTCIILNFDDPDHCFGQGSLHSIFNVQIFFLALAGIFVSISRYSNIAPATLAKAYQAIADSADKDLSLLSAPGVVIKFFHALSWHQIFPDIGQIILSVAWIACFAIVSLPAFVKFLPLRDQRYRDTTIRPYLAQFVPKERPPDPLEMDDDSITKFAKKFAHNSFWPVGDGKATILFTLAHSVLLFILVPMPLISWELVIFDLSLLVILAVLLTQATFLLFRQALRFVDERLIDIKAEG